MSIIVITHREIDEQTGQEEEFVSHGVDEATLENVVLQQERLRDVVKKWGIVRFPGGYRMP
jgi:hypothetical protein